MSLGAAYAALDAELSVLDGHLKDFAVRKGTINSQASFNLLDEALVEGLLSRIWQHWCRFCRTCLIESCMGTVTTAGVTVAALVHASSEEHVSAASINANRRNAKPPFWSGTNAVLRKEPTWGDVDVLMRIVQRLQPGNHSQIAAAVSTVSSAVKAVQLLRNGTAHHNHQTMSEIQGLRSAYLVFPIGHPVHALFWTVPSNGAYLFSHVVDELRFAAKSASA